MSLRRGCLILLVVCGPYEVCVGWCLGRWAGRVYPVARGVLSIYLSISGVHGGSYGEDTFLLVRMVLPLLLLGDGDGACLMYSPLGCRCFRVTRHRRQWCDGCRSCVALNPRPW